MFVRSASTIILVLCSWLTCTPVLGARVISKGGSAAHPVEAGLLQQTEVLAQDASDTMDTSSNMSSAEVTEFNPKCPRLTQPAQGIIPNAIHIKILGANNLAWSVTDTPDPYVRFWVGSEKKYNTFADWKDKEKKWLGKTHYVNNNRDAQWNYGCTFFYEPGDEPLFHARVMDRDFFTDDDLGRIGKEGAQHGVTIKEILTHDAQLDGEFDVTFSLYDNKLKKIEGRKGQATTLSVRFTVLRDPSKYMLTKAKNSNSGNVGHIA